jgi:LmbE family N-acetylglucosaminyl deacetylase
MNREIFEQPVQVSLPEAQAVVAISPHFDDEAIGCGGTLYKHHLAGHRVAVVFMTDGKAGYAFTALRETALMQERKQEAWCAARVLGYEELVFLDHPESRLRASQRARGDVAEVLARLRPDVVYLPSFLDTHVDHRATFHIVASCARHLDFSPVFYLYETWAPVVANCVVEINLEKKIEGIRSYRSQLGSDEMYVAWCRSLAKYRALTSLLSVDRHAECFWRTNATGLCQLAQAAR